MLMVNLRTHLCPLNIVEIYTSLNVEQNYTQWIQDKGDNKKIHSLSLQICLDFLPGVPCSAFMTE